MRFVLIARSPHEQFNQAVRDGSIGGKMQRVVDAMQAEAVYFTELGGLRTAICIINIDDVSEIPKYAEPWFLTFNADVEFHPTMTPEDLGRAGLDGLGQEWA